MTTSPHDADNQGHDEGDILGPMDTIAWGAGVLGVVLGSIVALAFAIATGAI
jgi:hypothetical protein